MNSIFYISLLWIILLLSIAMLSRYKERALSLKDRYFRLMIYAAVCVCAGEGLGLAWLFYISAGILTGFSILYIFRSERQPLLIAVIPAAAAGCAAGRLLDVESMASFCVSAAIVSIYISGLLDKISQDELTGLNNRREFDRYIDGLFGSTESQTAVFLAMIDIDGFKMINDMEGHLAGDLLLKEFAGELKKICGRLPGRVFLARYGGDEFVIAGSGCTEDDMAELEEHISKARPKASCGIAYGPAGSYASPQELIDRADRLMYEKKGRG